MKLMVLFAIVVLSVFTASNNVFAQVAGNVIYSQEKGNVGVTENKKIYQETPSGNVFISSSTVMFESSILMNVKADEYVTTLAVEQECVNVEECSQKLDDRISGFITALGGIGIDRERVFVDFVAQNRIYDFDVSKTQSYRPALGLNLPMLLIICPIAFGLLP